MVHDASCGWNKYAPDISSRISTEIVSIRRQSHHQNTTVGNSDDLLEIKSFIFVFFET